MLPNFKRASTRRYVQLRRISNLAVKIPNQNQIHVVYPLQTTAYVETNLTKVACYIGNEIKKTSQLNLDNKRQRWLEDA